MKGKKSDPKLQGDRPPKDPKDRTGRKDRTELFSQKGQQLSERATGQGPKVIQSHAELAELLHAHFSQGFGVGKCCGIRGIPGGPGAM